MQLVGRSKLAKTLPRALPRTAVDALLDSMALDFERRRQTDWAERDLAIILTSLLAGLRADELRQLDVGGQAMPHCSLDVMDNASPVEPCNPE